MGNNATYQATTQVIGSGLGYVGPAIGDTQQTTPSSTNAPPPQAYTLSAGQTELLMPPATFAFSRVQLLPMSSPSANAKSVVTSTGVVAAAGWTDGSITLPAVPGGALYIVSAGTEGLLAAFS